MTVQPAPGGNRFFTAVPSETEEQRKEREARQVEEKKQNEINALKMEIEERQKRLAELSV
jgi:hypothetical protein